MYVSVLHVCTPGRLMHICTYICMYTCSVHSKHLKSMHGTLRGATPASFRHKTLISHHLMLTAGAMPIGQTTPHCDLQGHNSHTTKAWLCVTDSHHVVQIGDFTSRGGRGRQWEV